MEAPGKLQTGKSSASLAAMIRARSAGLTMGPSVTSSDAAPTSPKAAAAPNSPTNMAKPVPPPAPVAPVPPPARSAPSPPPPAAAPPARSSSPPPPPSHVPPPPKHAPTIVSIETMMQRTASQSSPPPAARTAAPSFAPPAPATAPAPAPAPAPAVIFSACPVSPMKSTSPLPEEVAPLTEAPKPSTRYAPKVVVVPGAAKCFICTKTVYKMEEVIAIGEIWHDKCFTCGGKNQDGCNKMLKRDGYLDHGGQPYCNPCYNKLFRPKGYGYSNALSVDYGPSPAEMRSLSPQKPAPAPVAVPTPAPARAPAPAPVTSAVKSAVMSAESSFAKPSPPVSRTPQAVSPSKPCPPTPPAHAPAPAYTPTNNSSVPNATTAPKCTICAKTVYKMEEMVAVGRVWHTSCFTCGGSHSDGCGKVLNRTNYVDHDNQPYCQACHARQFGPKGFGHDIAMLSTGLVSTDLPDMEGLAVQTTTGSVISTGPQKQVSIGTTKGKDSILFKEAAYVGDNDEVDEGEW